MGGNNPVNSKTFEVTLDTHTTLLTTGITLVSGDPDIARAFSQNKRFTISALPKSYNHAFEDLSYHDAVSIISTDNEGIFSGTSNKLYTFVCYKSTSTYNYQVNYANPHDRNAQVACLMVNTNGDIKAVGNGTYRLVSNTYIISISWND